MKNFSKLSLATLLVSAACGVSANGLYSDANGSVFLSGDVEHDIYYKLNDALDSTSANAEVKGMDETKQSGRIRLEFSGERVLDNGNFAEFDVEALANDSSMDTDNAYFRFGMQGNWAITTGRFEATDMFPTGQDTYMDDDDQYQLEIARGRSSDGAVMITKELGALHLEANILASTDDVTYKGLGYTNVIQPKISDTTSQNSSNPVWIRPVIEYTSGNITLGAGIERSINTDDAPEGYALKFTYSTDEVTVNAAMARVSWEMTTNSGFTAAANSDFDINTTSMTLNTIIKNFGFGLFLTKLEDKKDALDDYKQTEGYVSYKIDNVLGMDNFEIYPAAFMQKTDFDDPAVKSVKEGGLKVRLKYYF